MGQDRPRPASWRGEFVYLTELWVVRESVAEGTLPALLDGLADYGFAVGTTTLEHAVGDISAAILANQAMSAKTRLRD